MEIEVFRGSEAKEVPEYRETVSRNIKNIENRPKRSKDNPQAEYSPRSDISDLGKMEVVVPWRYEAQTVPKHRQSMLTITKTSKIDRKCQNNIKTRFSPLISHIRGQNKPHSQSTVNTLP